MSLPARGEPGGDGEMATAVAEVISLAQTILPSQRQPGGEGIAFFAAVLRSAGIGAEEVRPAFLEYCKTGRFAPVPADLIEAAKRLRFRAEAERTEREAQRRSERLAEEQRAREAEWAALSPEERKARSEEFRKMLAEVRGLTRRLPE